MPRNPRKRIDIIAIAPAAFIDEHLCNSRSHYVSRDFVPYFDFLGYIRNKESVIKIKPHPNAKIHDHNFDSPSFIPLGNENLKICFYKKIFSCIIFLYEKFFNRGTV